jgi:cell division protein FtsB
MKLGKCLIAFVLFIGFFITFGKRGLIDSYTMKERVHALREYNQQLVLQNNALKEDILLLRNDLPYVETIARNELGMVRKGDIVYRFSR